MRPEGAVARELVVLPAAGRARVGGAEHDDPGAVVDRARELDDAEHAEQPVQNVPQEEAAEQPAVADEARRRDEARVQRVDGDAAAPEPSLQLVRKKEIGELAPAVRERRLVLARPLELEVGEVAQRRPPAALAAALRRVVQRRRDDDDARRRRAPPAAAGWSAGNGRGG